MDALGFDGEKWVERKGINPTEAKRIEESESLTWLRMERAKDASLGQLQQQFELHPLAIDDVRDENQPAKVVDYKDMTFLCIRVPDFKSGDYEIDWEQVGVFLGHDWCLTTSTETIQPLDGVRDRLIDVGLAEDDASLSHLVYWIIDTLVNSWFDFITIMEKDLEVLEDDIFKQATHENLDQVRKIKKLVTRAFRSALTTRDAIVQLERDDHPNIEGSTRIYLRHVTDKVNRVVDRLEHTREIALTCQDTWNAALANEQNAVMKRLSVGGALLLIPTFLAGLAGVNFPDFPQLNLFWWFSGGMLAFVVAGFIWLSRKRLL